MLNALNSDNSSCNSKLKSSSFLCSKGPSQLWESAAARYEWGYLKWERPARLPEGHIKWPKANSDVPGCLLNTQAESGKTSKPGKFQDKSELLNFYQLLQGTHHGDEDTVILDDLTQKPEEAMKAMRFLPLVSEHFRSVQKTCPLQSGTELVLRGLAFWLFLLFFRQQQCTEN